MLIKIKAEDLKKAASEMDSVMKGNPLPILNGLLITAEENGIMLSANNLGILVKKQIPGTVLTCGKAVMHRDDLSTVLKMKDDIEIELDGDQFTVKSNRIFKFMVRNAADEFPLFPEVPEGEPVFAIPEKDLLYCLKLKKLIADSQQQLRLCGLWFDKNNVLACDGYRLGKIEINYETAERFMAPDFVLACLAKALDAKSSSLVEFFISEKRNVKARSDNFEIAYKQYDGEFISYENQFGSSATKTAVIQKRDLAEAVGFMCDVSKSAGRSKANAKAPVVYSFADSKLKLLYKAADKQVEEEIQYTNAGEDKIDLTIGFNLYYVQELLSIMDGEKISMNFNQPHSPSIIQGENANEKYLLLPVRLKDAA